MSRAPSLHALDIFRPVEVTTLTRKERTALFSYSCKQYSPRERVYPPYISKRPESSRKKELRKAAEKLMGKHRRFGFTKQGYGRFCVSAWRITKGSPLQAEFLNLLAGLKMQDLAVLVRITRKHINYKLDWLNSAPRRARSDRWGS